MFLSYIVSTKGMKHVHVYCKRNKDCFICFVAIYVMNFYHEIHDCLAAFILVFV